MEKKLEIPFGNYKIVAQIFDMNEPEIPPEFAVFLCDKEDYVIQDICLVRQHYEINRSTMEFERWNDLIDCLVWGESGNEDYTDKHVIGIYEEDEE